MEARRESKTFDSTSKITKKLANSICATCQLFANKPVKPPPLGGGYKGVSDVFRTQSTNDVT